jgi:Spy/CpxP family protein refolding chaperone
MKTLTCTLMTILLAAMASAQQPMMGPPPPMGGPMAGPPGRGPGGGFFPVELVMRNQQAIGLAPEQQQTIQAAMQKTSPRFTELQWKLSAEEEALDALIKEKTSDVDKVLAQLDKVLVVENEMKRLQLALMLAVKNVLTAEQQETLAKIRQRDRPPQMGAPPRDQGPPPGGE